MPTFYEYRCSSGHSFELFRSVDARDDPALCPSNPAGGYPARRVLSVPTIHFPRALYTQWSDVFPDTSPRELARDKTVERYDDSLPDRPTVQTDRVALKQAWEHTLATHGRPEGWQG